MMSENKKAPNKDFYVGYLPAPSAITRFYNIAIPVMLVLGLAFSYWASQGQASAGEGVWDLTGEVEITGYLTVDPYPVIHIPGASPRSVVLVEQTKFGADDRALQHANQWVTISGFAITRGDWYMLQLLPTSTFTQADDAGTGAMPAVPMGEVELSGEIIDSKCFLGVMKPGSGKVHRACAAMCLRGGIPPMLVVKNESGERYGFMLMNENGDSASIDLADLVAVPIRLRGQMEQR
jgi:hypothetical protein